MNLRDVKKHRSNNWTQPSSNILVCYWDDGESRIPDLQLSCGKGIEFFKLYLGRQRSCCWRRRWEQKHHDLIMISSRSHHVRTCWRRRRLEQEHHDPIMIALCSDLLKITTNLTVTRSVAHDGGEAHGLMWNQESNQGHLICDSAENAWNDQNLHSKSLSSGLLASQDLIDLAKADCLSLF